MNAYHRRHQQQKRSGISVYVHRAGHSCWCHHPERYQRHRMIVVQVGIVHRRHMKGGYLMNSLLSYWYPDSYSSLSSLWRNLMFLVVVDMP